MHPIIFSTSFGKTTVPLTGIRSRSQSKNLSKRFIGPWCERSWFLSNVPIEDQSLPVEQSSWLRLFVCQHSFTHGRGGSRFDRFKAPSKSRGSPYVRGEHQLGALDVVVALRGMVFSLGVATFPPRTEKSAHRTGSNHLENTLQD